MAKGFVGAVAAACFLTLPSVAAAQAISQPEWYTSVGPGTSGIGQTFTATIDGYVSTIRIGRAGYSPAGTPGILRVYAGGGGVVGAPLVEATFEQASVPTRGVMQSVTLPAPLAVTAGEQYSIHVTGSLLSMKDGDPYPGGSFFFAPSDFLPDYDLAFEVVQAPPAVPTISEWTMILLGALLAGGAALYIQRRRTA